MPKNLKQIFPEKEYRGLSPNFHIQVSVSELYIPTMSLPVLLEEICRLILGIYKSTKYVHIKSTTVYAPRRNWDSPQPPTRRVVCPSPLFLGGGEHSLARKGLGESQFRRGAYTVVLFICTYFVYKSLKDT